MLLHCVADLDDTVEALRCDLHLEITSVTEDCK